jgi:hypothetical protein
MTTGSGTRRYSPPGAAHKGARAPGPPTGRPSFVPDDPFEKDMEGFEEAGG